MKTYRPTTKSRRFMTTLPYKELLSGAPPYKPLLKAKKNQAGRNGFGRITTRHQGALYADGERRYHIVPKTVAVGSTFIVSQKAPLTPGNRLPLGSVPVGTFVYNIELRPGAGSVLVRSAGTAAEVIAHDAGYAQIKLPSTEVRKVSDLCWASIGNVGNEEYMLVVYGKAGRSRWLGIRPTVRGTAMNPVDHPHGGGEGRQGRGLRRAKTKWGKPSGKGQKTRTPKKYSNVFIVSRRKVGKRRKG